MDEGGEPSIVRRESSIVSGEWSVVSDSSSHLFALRRHCVTLINVLRAMALDGSETATNTRYEQGDAQ